MSEVWLTSGGATVQLQTWTHDAAGRLLTAQDPDGTYTYTYYATNRVERADGPFGAWQTYAYDGAGNREGVTDSTGAITTVTFDERNRQSSERSAGAGIAAVRFDYAYTNRGQRDSVTRYSDVAGTTLAGTTTHAYDDAGRHTGTTHKSAAGTALLTLVYAYDVADRLTARTDRGVTTSYQYDSGNRLTEDGAQAFDYDAAGNRDSAGYTTDPGNRITSDGTWNYTHDTEGNVTKRTKTGETWVYAYDHRNQLLTAKKSATDGGAATAIVTYTYDADGRRIGRSAWDGTTTTVERYALDAADPAKPRALGNEGADVYAVLDGTNAVVGRWVSGVGFDEQVARRDAGGSVGWFLTDRQGSARMAVSSAGTALASAAWDGYGVAAAGSTLWGGIGFAGVRHDDLTNLDSNGHGTREYLSFAGVWLQSDPRWPLTGEANPYVYVQNNPTNLVDPSGYQGDEPSPFLQMARGAMQQGAEIARQMAAQQGGAAPVAMELPEWARKHNARQATLFPSSTPTLLAAEPVQGEIANANSFLDSEDILRVIRGQKPRTASDLTYAEETALVYNAIQASRPEPPPYYRNPRARPYEPRLYAADLLYMQTEAHGPNAVAAHTPAIKAIVNDPRANSYLSTFAMCTFTVGAEFTTPFGVQGSLYIGDSIDVAMGRQSYMAYNPIVPSDRGSAAHSLWVAQTEAQGRLSVGVSLVGIVGGFTSAPPMSGRSGPYYTTGGFGQTGRRVAAAQGASSAAGLVYSEAQLAAFGQSRAAFSGTTLAQGPTRSALTIRPSLALQDAQAMLGNPIHDVYAGPRSAIRWHVDPVTMPLDIKHNLLVNGSYVKNPGAKPIESLVNQHQKLLDPVSGDVANGKYMYVIDEAGTIIIGTRYGGRMPHPTLIGGSDPTVKAAGMVDIRGGKIYSVDNASGHFKPGTASLDYAKDSFDLLHKKFDLPNKKSVFKNFQGYLDHSGKVILPPN